MITNLRYADDIVLLATSEAELRYRYRSWWIAYYESAANAAYTRQRRQDQGNGENGIACRTLIQNEQLKPGADLRKKLRRHADLTTHPIHALVCTGGAMICTLHLSNLLILVRFRRRWKKM